MTNQTISSIVGITEMLKGLFLQSGKLIVNGGWLEWSAIRILQGVLCLIGKGI